MEKTLKLVTKAQEILRNNDRGGYTIPCGHLYPFQWYWDSVINALGWQSFDEPRAWQELDFLIKGQWDNGFIPHIIFHQESEDYFPGHDVWGTSDFALPSSRISQPPILALGYWLLYCNAKDKKSARERLIKVFDNLCKHYNWWIVNRQRHDFPGLVASVHPWETGMDNSPVWDEPLKRVPMFEGSYTRKDTSLVNATQRPTNQEYDKYLYMVDLLKNGATDEQLIETGPFSVYDLCIVSLLHKSADALIKIAEVLGQEDSENLKELKGFMANTSRSIQQLWSEEGYFVTRDALQNKPLKQKISASFLPMYAKLATKQQAEMMNQTIIEELAKVEYGVPSTFSNEKGFDSSRYWRGPVWLHINWMIAQGLNEYGFTETAQQIRQNIYSLVEKSGFYEYYDPISGKGCGGNDFSWTAAIYLFEGNNI